MRAALASGDVSLKDELLCLLDELAREEQLFHSSIADIESNGHGLEEKHYLLVDQYGGEEGHRQLKQTHEAMFTAHRKINIEHEMALQRCDHVGKQVRAGLYSEAEMAMELARAGDFLRHIKREHACVFHERQKILADHEAFVKALGITLEAE
jgi:hypothetical protein